jgi:hypothetical protein
MVFFGAGFLLGRFGGTDGINHAVSTSIVSRRFGGGGRRDVAGAGRAVGRLEARGGCAEPRLLRGGIERFAAMDFA